MFSSKPMKVLPVLAGAAFAVGLIGQASALPVDSSLRKAATEASPMVQDVRYVAKKKHVAKRHVVRKKGARRYVRRGVGPAAAFGAVAAGIGAAIAADRYNDGYYYGPGGYGYGYGPGYYDYGYNYGYYPPAAYYGPRYRYRHVHRPPVYPNPGGPIYGGRPIGGPVTAPIGGGFVRPNPGFGGGVVRPNPGFGGSGIVRPQGLGGGGGGFVGGAAPPLGGATTMTVR
ncbi:hypothetical protein [Methylocella sp. CPCC 101449]|uniref:hypothetical protein n=1 Tax=Methylocella sp. CPCC 101449 TaxID=2987531 RepID=UPI00288DBC7E|nr:hypothetical protein [Methylocella sp. CPCC 101449]MDT2022662.1 hypothetical protein [Methylocella sp. CPCC 101449]